MTSSKRAILWDPYLDVLGGGEQYCLFAMRALERQGYDITIAWPTSLESEIQKKFDIPFKHIHWDHEIFAPSTSALARAHALAKFDVLLTITNGSYFFSPAKHNLLYAMVPRPAIYPHKIIDRIKTNNWQIIANSLFTKSQLKKHGFQTKVHYPMISPDFLKRVAPGGKTQKKSLILSVGRFFGQLHTKQHSLIIDTFNRLQRLEQFRSMKLVIAGGLKDEDREYFETVKELAAKNKNIKLIPNIPYHDLVDLYKQARYFWHFTGYGIDEQVHPQQVEHLGITPLEAMAAGCVVCAVGRGGPVEIIKPNETGILFETANELIVHMQMLNADKQLTSQIAQNAQTYVRKEFSQDTFTQNLMALIT